MLTLALAGLLLAAGSARAAPFAVPLQPGEGSPTLYGSGVAVAVRTASGGIQIRSIDPAGNRSTVATFPYVLGLGVVMDGSEQALAVRETAVTCLYCKYDGLYRVHADAVYAGIIGQPLECVVGFRPGVRCGSSPCGDPVVSGAVLAVCVPDGLLVRDLSLTTPASTTIAPLRRYALAGEVVAGIDADDKLVVRRWRSGETLMSLTAPVQRVLSLATDGTVLFEIRHEDLFGPSRLGWASPQSPVVHEFVQRAFLDDLKGSGAVLGSLAARERESVSPGTYTFLNTGGETISEFHEPAHLPGWDFDGNRAAYVSAPCATSTLVVAELGHPAPAHPEGLCRAARASPAATLKGRYLVLELRCESSPGLGCLGRVRVTAGFGRRSVRTLGEGLFAIADGNSRLVKVLLSRAARRWIERRRPTRLTAISIAQTSDVIDAAPEVLRRAVHLVYP